MKKTRKRTKPIRCPYCGRNAQLKPASEIYQDINAKERLYVCSGYPECNSYVGVHNNSHRPLGVLANSELRHKRILAHRHFDQIWKRNIMSRGNAYRWLRDSFGLRQEQAHIGRFSEYMCEELIGRCKEVLINCQLAG